MKITKFDVAYLKMAKTWAELSYCKRKQVGALIVKDRMIISDGYNGTPSGFENECEDENGNTQWYVLHAEANAILKLKVFYSSFIHELEVLMNISKVADHKFKVGSKVTHTKFGDGVIKDLDSKTIAIRFKNGQIKQLSLELCIEKDLLSLT